MYIITINVLQGEIRGMCAGSHLLSVTRCPIKDDATMSVVVVGAV